MLSNFCGPEYIPGIRLALKMTFHGQVWHSGTDFFLLFFILMLPNNGTNMKIYIA